MSLAGPVRAETRTLRLFNTHTHETITVTYKKNGKYIPSALRELNRFLRDWRRNEATKMDPKLLDLVWEVYKKAGGSKPIHVVSAYRSPATNNMLRSRSRGVARKSQHMKGRAMDFFIPGVNLSKLRAAGLRMEVGGVGFYPKSGSPFVHMDTGRVRHWPRMTRKQLASVFPDGKTIHIPSDGKPMPRYEQALAELKRRQNGGGRTEYAREDSSPSRREKPSAVQVASKSEPALVDDEDIVQPTGVTPASSGSGGNPFSGLVSRITGRSGPTPPAEVPEQAEAKPEEPAQAETAPASVPVPQPEPEVTDQPVLVAATPLAKPRQAAAPATVAAQQQVQPAPETPAAPLPSRYMLAAATSATAPAPPAEPAAVAAAPAESPFGAPDLRKAPVSNNPADYVLASLPPSNRSTGTSGDPVEAANSVIASRKPAARPEIDTDQPPMLAYADANPTLPLEKSRFADFVGSLPRTAVRPEPAPAAEQPKRYAAIAPKEPLTASDQEPVRAMPLIGDLRSLLDMTGPFDAGTQFASVGKFLTTSTTTRTQLFADMRHPSVDSLGSYFEKPQRVLRTTFVRGFASELRTDRFTGAAIGIIRSVYTP